MDEKTYLRHVGALASDSYHATIIPERELDWMLFAAKAAARWADSVKRGLFYGTDTELKTGPAPTSLQHNPILRDLVHAALGLFTESGELLEHIHDVLTGSVELDKVNVFEEVGDCHWYLGLLHRFLGTLPSQAYEANIAKLRKRYPDRFTEEKAQHEARNLEAERELLEQYLDELKRDIQAAEDATYEGRRS
jgi:NTP pyrophosphatase (non-canonical NTP hydrolase)